MAQLISSLFVLILPCFAFSLQLLPFSVYARHNSHVILLNEIVCCWEIHSRFKWFDRFSALKYCFGRVRNRRVKSNIVQLYNQYKYITKSYSKSGINLSVSEKVDKGSHLEKKCVRKWKKKRSIKKRDRQKDRWMEKGKEKIR